MSIALLLQGALGGAFLVILVLILVAAVVLLAAVFGGTLGGGGASSKGETTAPIIPPGTIMAASGLGLAGLGAYYGSIGFGFLGIILGGWPITGDRGFSGSWRAFSPSLRSSSD